MTRALNPFLPLSEYIPDGEPHVFGDRIYLFGSHDKEGGTRFCELGDYVGWSAPVDDLGAWRNEGIIYSPTQDPQYREGVTDLYAPDVVQGNDGRFYLYYVLSGSAGEGFKSPISVAVCDTPTGRYEYLGLVQNPDGSPFLRYLTHDPGLINDNGVIRMYYGWSFSTTVMAQAATDGEPAYVPAAHEIPAEQLEQAKIYLFGRSQQELAAEEHDIMGANVITLEDDMLTVVGDPKRIVPGQFDAEGTSFAEHPFFEAASIRKINGVYYFIYSAAGMHELCYATSSYPDRGFKFGGTIISNGDVGLGGRALSERSNATGTNHGSIEQVHGQWYVFYHRMTHNSGYSRQACAEPIEINPDGSISQVEVTSSGLNGGPLPARGTYPAVIASSITNGSMQHVSNGFGPSDAPHVTNEGKDRFIANISDGTVVQFKHFDFKGPTSLAIEARGAEGAFDVFVESAHVAEVPLQQSPDWNRVHARFDVWGTASLTLKYRGIGTVNMKEIAFG